MTAVNASSGSIAGAAELIDELVDQLQAGRDIEEFIAAHPEDAETIRRLLPAVRMMTNLSRSAEDSAAVLESTSTPLELGDLGDFRIIREIGRGGMGIVYEAEQSSLSRRVALKVLPFAATMDPRHLQRFHNEAKAAASLHHEHIVPVYAVGCERGVHYYAMQFIDGTTLAQGIEEIKEELNHRGAEDTEKNRITAPLSSLCTLCLCGNESSFFRHVAALVADAADALEYAHSVGIVHRDIKPANLLIDTAGKVWIADFGLARFGPDAGLTMTGDLLGTLRYMAPEQALAKHGLVDHRVDVYGLGCILYELLTGKPAVGGEDKQEILRRIAFEEPVALWKLDKVISAGLETIALKCLAKEPKERYATAGELAADLRRFVEDKPIKARRPTARQRLARLSRRHPVLAATIALTAGLLIAGLWGWQRQASSADASARNVAEEAKKLQATGRYPEALAVARQALNSLPGLGGDARLRRAVEERVADLSFLCQLDEIRLTQAELSLSFRAGEARFSPADFYVESSGFDVAAAAPFYQQAFDDYGVDVLTGEPATIVAAIERRAIRPELADALDDWSRLVVAKESRQRIETLAEALQPDATMARLHSASRSGDSEGLALLAVEVAETAPPGLTDRLARELGRRGRREDAQRLLRAGSRRYPGDFWLNTDLAALLLQPRPGGNVDPADVVEALGLRRAALAVRPNSAGAWLNFGVALRILNRNQEAVAAYRRVIELRPDCSTAYHNLGVTLGALGRVDEEEKCLRKWAELRPDDAGTHFSFGAWLDLHSRPEDGITELRRAIKLKPDFALAYSSLGHAYAELLRLDEAIEAYKRAIDSYRKALQLNPQDAETHCNLGLNLRLQEQFAESLKHIRRGHELGSQRADWPYPSADWLRTAETLAAIEARLPSIMSGDAAPANAAEAVAVAKYCEDVKSLFFAAVQFYSDAFLTDPALEKAHRASAAACAILAAAGKGTDEVKLDDSERVRLRRSALDWLQADVAAWAVAPADERERGKRKWTLEHLRNESAFGSVHNDALAKLPEAERLAWQKLWADVVELQRRCEQPYTQDKPAPPPKE